MVSNDYDLTCTNRLQNKNQPADDVAFLAEQLQKIFVKPWKEINAFEIPSINDLVNLLEDTPFTNPICWIQNR